MPDRGVILASAAGALAAAALIGAVIYDRVMADYEELYAEDRHG